MSLLWTAVVLFVGVFFGMWLTVLLLPIGQLFINRSNEQNVFTFELGSLDPHELMKRKLMLIRIKDITQK